MPVGSSREGVIIETERVAVECECAADAVPRLAEGTELIGEYQGSGFQQPRYLVRRADGQVIQLTRLLHLLVVALDGQRDLAHVAEVLSAEFGRVVQPQQVRYLIEKRLRPAGIVPADPQAADAKQRSRNEITYPIE